MSSQRLRRSTARTRLPLESVSSKSIPVPFFDYTYCPDLCPTTLGEIAGALALLGPLAAQVQPIFVSIDPQRDTPEALREYVQNFDARILPLSGNAEQLARAAGSFGGVFYKVPGPDTGRIYLRS
jgi:protein SCO1/2